MRQVTSVPWWLPWAHVEALMRRPLTVPQPNLRQPLLIPEVDGFQGGFCATMEVIWRCNRLSVHCTSVLLMLPIDTSSS
jgi:hypothetical protein